MVNMENAEEVLQILDRFTRLKQKEIPKELDEYLQYVAKTGDTVFKWSSLKYLFREKLLNVIKHFHDTSPRVDEIPQYPNVDPFNYESMKSSLLERLELFNAAPFTIQRLCELLIDPRKQYSRIDKFMRALEKNILVVSTIEPGRKRTESENGDSLDSVVNGDLSLDVNVDIDMENEPLFNMETQNGNGTAAPEATVGGESISDRKEKHVNDDVNDDTLPSPKKAKLDLGEEDTKQTDNINDSMSEGKEDKLTDSKTDTETVATTSKEVNAENNTDKIIVGNIEVKVENEDIAKVKETIKDQKEIITSEKSTTKNEDEEEKKKLEKLEKNDEVKLGEEQTKEIIGDEIKAENEITEIDAITKSNEKDNEKMIDNKSNSQEQEKIIEKQEIEKCEKEETVAATVDSESTLKEKMQGNNLDTTKGKSEQEKPENKLVIENTTASSAKKPTTDIVNTTGITVEKQVKESVESKDDPNIPIDTKVEMPTIEASAEKLSVINNKPETTIKIKDVENEISSSTTQVAKTEVQSTEDVGDNKNAKDNAVNVVIVKEIETEIKAAAVDEATPTPIEADFPITAPIDEDAPTISALGAPAVEITTADTTASADSIEATPTLVLNDQPMEDVPLDEMPSTIEEVVMAESVGATEMATDTIEPTKDEPAGMEVDDTSQEAMDQ